MSEISAVHLRIEGRVQGVCYRASCEEEARKNKLVGWVRNRPDGSVEALAQGEPAALRRWIAWCHQGPPAARVERVIESQAALDAALTEFRARR